MKINIQQLGDPEEVSMAMRATAGRKELNSDGTKVKEMHYHEHWNGRYKSIYRYGHRYLKKNVGRPWDVVFSELCEKIKTDKDILVNYQWESAKDAFRGMVDIHNECRTYGYNSHYCDDYYVDDNGILRTHLKDKPAHHKDKVFVKTGVHYKLKKEAQPYIPYIRNILMHCMSWKSLNELLCDDITPTQKERMDWSLKCNSWKVNDMVEHIRRTERDKRRYWIGWESGVWCLFDTITDGYYITRTKNRRIQLHKEGQDQRNKTSRDLLKEKKDKQESLLHIIMKKRKEEERQKDLIKIQAHGMDEKTSFRGEEYHGQKRKKK